jgi:hypothetical protein
MNNITIKLWRQQVANLSDEKKGYYILSAEGRFIRYAFITKADGELYAKYNPIETDNKGSLSFSNRKYEKLIKWTQQEIDKGLMVSVGNKNKRKYVCKSFQN